MARTKKIMNESNQSEQATSIESLLTKEIESPVSLTLDTAKPFNSSDYPETVPFDPSSLNPDALKKASKELKEQLFQQAKGEEGRIHVPVPDWAEREIFNLAPILNDRRWKMGDCVTRGQDFLVYFIISHYGPLRSDVMSREHRLHNGLLCNSLMRLRFWGLVEEKDGKWRTA